MPKIQELTPSPSFSSELGAQLGQGVGKGIQSALEQFHQAKQQEALGDQFESIGLPRELAGLDPQIVKQFMAAQQKQSLMQQLMGPSQAAADTVPLGETPGVGRQPQPTQEISPRDVEAAILVDPNLGRVRQQERKLQQTQKETRRERQAGRSFTRNLKYLEKQSNILMEAPKEKLALTQMRGALESGNFNSLRNVIGEMTGKEFLKTASAQTVNAASKTLLMSTLASLTGRPNQFIERQITKALISPLYRDAANMLILEGLEGLSHLKDKHAETALDLEEKYTSRGEEVPRNLQRLVQKNLEKETRDFEKNYQNRVIELLDLKKPAGERKGGDLGNMTDPDGNLRDVPKDQIEDAIKAGYKLIR